MSDLPADDPSSPCACGSGLRRDRCCGFDWSAPQAEPTPEIGRVREALAAGDVAEALRLLYQIRSGESRTTAAETLLARILRLDPNDLATTQALAALLFARGALAEAEIHARNAVRLAPADPQSHNLMGMIMTEAHRPQVAEFHYRRAMALLTAPSAILFANLAWNLKNQGRITESRELYRQSVGLDPNVFQTIYGWARMEETDRNFARAGELLDAAERLSPGSRMVRLPRAELLGRNKDHAGAIAILDDMEREPGGGLGPVEWTEKGQLLDRMGRHADAFAAFTAGKRALPLPADGPAARRMPGPARSHRRPSR
jgi:tetratricopeptide (TPR) repeat protein